MNRFLTVSRVLTQSFETDHKSLCFNEILTETILTQLLSVFQCQNSLSFCTNFDNRNSFTSKLLYNILKIVKMDYDTTTRSKVCQNPPL